MVFAWSASPREMAEAWRRQSEGEVSTVNNSGKCTWKRSRKRHRGGGAERPTQIRANPLYHDAFAPDTPYISKNVGVYVGSSGDPQPVSWCFLCQFSYQVPSGNSWSMNSLRALFSAHFLKFSGVKAEPLRPFPNLLILS